MSWQVTGVRQDPWANAHRVQVEVMKSPEQRGLYLHPELYGLPESASIESIKKRPGPIPAEPVYHGNNVVGGPAPAPAGIATKEAR